MTEKYCKLLEFDAVKARVQSFTGSEEAREEIGRLLPLTNIEETVTLKKNISAIIERINSCDNESRSALPSAGHIISKLGVEELVPETREFFELGFFIEESLRVVQWLSQSRFLKEHLLQDAAECAAECKAVSSEIFSVINKDGTLKDLPVFAGIKSAISRTGTELDGIIKSFFSNEGTKFMLQSNLPSVRDGRTVLALKANFRGRIAGIVHEVSGTGQTLFIEPQEVVDKNNELTILKQELELEIRKVFRALAKSVSPHREVLDRFHRRIIYIETLRARARYALAAKGVFAAESGAVRLAGARHPLLGADAVPLDIELQSGVRTLIISGPNAGGKTVLLKTIGLFALMNQSGIALPASEGTALPVFDCVYIDIGDGQSLSGALSTFSSSMNNIRSIYENAGPDSLVLLDELAGATESVEGGALAAAIADAFLKKGCISFITTHHSALKTYGALTDGVENAGMSFDSTSGTPEYKVMPGLSGESHAIETARNLGFPREIIDGALTRMKEGAGSADALLSELQKKQAHLNKEEEKLKAALENLAAEQNKNRELQFALRKEEAGLKRAFASEYGALIQEARARLENLVRRINEEAAARAASAGHPAEAENQAGAALARETTLEVRQFLNGETERLRKAEAAAENARKKIQEHKRRLTDGTALNPQDIKEGLAVLAGEKRLPGIVRRRGKKGFWLVETGSITLPFPEAELFEPRGTGSPGQAARRGANRVSVSLETSAPVIYELDLHGVRLKEALEALERQIDSAIVANLSRFTVLHGKGDGILSAGVHNYLKNHNAIKDYYFSRPEFGGTGRTEVILKS